MELLVIAAGLVLVSVVGLKVYRLWRAGMRQTQPLLMQRVLEHEGVSLSSGADERTVVQVASVARGCLLCRDQETCRAWLEGESSAALQEFCPNAETIAQLKAGRSAPGQGASG